MAELNLEHLRHSLTHLLGAAVLELYPGSKLAIGPAIEHGFYYDVDVAGTVSEADLPRLAEAMRRTLKTWRTFERQDVSAEEARRRFAGNPYKLELVEEIVARGEPLTFYTAGSFSDLCRGGHVEDARKIKPAGFTLHRVAGAYWRGDEGKPQLTRIYGLAFASQAELDEHLKMLEEAEKRDHRRLGRDLKLFAFSDYVGPGLPLWLPRGTVLVEELEQLARERELAAGYDRVKTPHIAKGVMYTTSGHLPYYAESMFPPMVVREESGDTAYYLRAMNCPHHHQVYAAEPRSYRDLPLRLTEYGTVYRYEKSGELFGLMRARCFNMNDAHIYCTPEQFAAEFQAVNELYRYYFKLFGLTKYVMRFSTHEAAGLGKKYVDEPALWREIETMVRQVLVGNGVNFVEVADEAAFYGPKIDVQVWSSTGHEFSIATNQVDFAVPQRFGLTYVDRDGQAKTPICIHRAPLGTHERFIGFLIEHYGGAFPVWLAPVQVAVVPVGENQAAAAAELAGLLRRRGRRVELIVADETVNKRIRQAEQAKVPYVLVVGDRELPSGGAWTEDAPLAVRVRGRADLLKLTLGEFSSRLDHEVQERLS